jgi:putative Holliday junction resolvase
MPAVPNPADEPRRALGVDLGERRIGLALSDPSRTVASPYEVLHRSGDRDADNAMILLAARDADATTIVVGLPLSLSGKAGPAAKQAQKDVDALRALAKGEFEIVLHDERLTTVTAERALMEARMNREARKRVVDKVAAAVMLQSWLEGAQAREQSSWQ